MIVKFFAAGTPVTQGSKTPFVTRDGKRAVLREGGSPRARSNHQAWRHAVATEARKVAATECPDGPLTGPIRLDLAFGLQRPASAPKRRRTWPTGARSGDLDKLCRAVLDALTGVLIADDSQVIELCASKDYGQPGAYVTMHAHIGCDGVWHYTRPREPACPKCGESAE